ncbi:efflux RND transporter periplasmic adaptor subunit, partial [Candidatus Bathyarchaeota archaeon]
MKYKKIKFLFLFVMLIIIVAFLLKVRKNEPRDIIYREIHPFYGDICVTVSTTGIVEPQNRVEIKPPIAGRIEEILGKEGDKVKKGDVLCLMSSTERAALLDAAHLKGEKELKYWEEVYKSTPLIAPIDGQVIVRAVEPGQTVTVNDTILVLSDRLIVKAQVDETDIGKVKLGQRAVITLDAYPDIKVEARVNHISYESKII